MRLMELYLKLVSDGSFGETCFVLLLQIVQRPLVIIPPGMNTEKTTVKLAICLLQIPPKTITVTCRFDNEYDFMVLTGVRKIIVGSNLVAVLLVTMRIAENVVVDIKSSKAKKLYSYSNLYS